MKDKLLAPITKAINTFLKLDSESQERLKKLSGKRVGIELLPVHIKFVCIFTEDKLDLQLVSELDTETQIIGTPLQMLGLMFHKTNRQQFFSEDVKIIGDAELGQQVIALFDELNIEWEEQLSQWIGDVPTQHISQWVNKFKTWMNNSNESCTQNINEYIHEEKQWLPTREALNDFFNDIDTLRMDIDRLEERINRLQPKSEHPS